MGKMRRWCDGAVMSKVALARRLGRLLARMKRGQREEDVSGLRAAGGALEAKKDASSAAALRVSMLALDPVEGPTLEILCETTRLVGWLELSAGTAGKGAASLTA